MAFGPPVCACCGALEGVEEHHLYLRADGCPDDLTVWLCHVCHGRTHGMRRRVNIRAATSAALAAVKARWKKEADETGKPMRTMGGVRTGQRAPTAEEQRRGALAVIAATLTAEGVPTPRGGAWTATAVRRVLTRVSEATIESEAA